MNRQLNIRGSLIEENSDCYVIAEIGHNHQGSLQQAMEMFRQAKDCGASAVKLQKRDNRSLYTNAMYNEPYNSLNSYGPTYGRHREALEFGREEYVELKLYAQEVGITFFATPFDFKSADLLAELDVPAFKIASLDLRNIPLLKYVASFRKPMIISTGAATMEDVERAYDAVMPINSQLCIMQCTAAYPAPYDELNLRMILTYRERFPDIVIGYSGHDDGTAVAVAAYTLGARVIEKHFTLNRGLKGTDHAFSLEPPQLKQMVQDLRGLRLALGDGAKKIYTSESPGIYKMGKKLVAGRHLPAGHMLAYEDIAIKSPGNGLSPHLLDKVLGKVLLQPLNADEDISYEILESAAL